MSYMTLSSQEKHLFFSFDTFPRIQQHYFSKYWGGRIHRPSPHLKFWGAVPPVPLGLCPCGAHTSNQKQMDVSNSKLKLYSCLACKLWTFWRIFMGVKTPVWALTETMHTVPYIIA